MNTYDLAKKFHKTYPELDFADLYGLAKLVTDESGGPIRPCKWMRVPMAKRLASLGLVILESSLPDLEIMASRYRIIERMGYKVQSFDYSVSPNWNKTGKWVIYATQETFDLILN